MSWAESKWIVDNILRKIGQQPNNMRSFVATPLSNTSIGLTFLEPQDSYVEGNLICSVGGVMVRYSTEDYPKTPSDGELVIVNKELGKYATTPFVIENLDEDTTYYFSAFPFSTQGVYNLSSSAVNRAKMAPANGEAVTVTINIDDDSAFSTVRVRCIDETDGTKTKVATLSPMKKTATFTVMTGHQYHVEFGEMKDYSQPTRTVSKVAEAGGTSEYTGNYEYFTSEIVTTYPKGSTVTCMKDNIKYTATDTSGSYTFKVHEVGTWTVTSTDGNQTSTRTVNITRTKERKTVTLAYFESTISVTYPVGATLTCSCGDTTYTAPNTSGTHTFTVQKAGTWTIKAVKGSDTSTNSVSITASGQSRSVTLYFANIYGIKRDITSSSPAWTRTNDAVGKTATATRGEVAGHSDFSSCYPWSGIKRETLSTNDVMVKIPKFWYRRYRSGNIEYIEIADKSASGFTLHPAFNHGGVAKDCFYVGAYVTNRNNKSTTGYSGSPTKTRAESRNDAKIKGNGWGIMDISALSAIQMLILVEFANNDVQSVIGRGYCDTSSMTPLGAGRCDGVSGLTGIPSGTDGEVSVVWRGIENLWGNGLAVVDGININKDTYYVCNDPSKYADGTATNYKALSFKGSTEWSWSYITQMGLDANNSHIMLPSAANGGSETTYYCDGCFGTSGWDCYAIAGGSTYKSSSGLFTSYLKGSGKMLSRFLYIPS